MDRRNDNVYQCFHLHFTLQAKQPTYRDRYKTSANDDELTQLTALLTVIFAHNCLENGVDMFKTPIRPLNFLHENFTFITIAKNIIL